MMIYSRFLLVSAAAWALSAMVAYGQEPKIPLPLKASLVLTPEFCASEIRRGTFRERFAVGEAACTTLEPALKGTFSSLTVTNALPTSGNSQLVLVPRFVDAGTVIGWYLLTIRQMDVFLEWTAKDMSGKTLWLETVHGSATHDPLAKHAGEDPLMGRALLKSLIANSVKDAATQSASKMCGAPELIKVARSH